MSTKHNIFITSCESYSGCAIAKQLLCEPYVGMVGAVFLGCVHKEAIPMVHDKAQMERLGTANAQFCEVDPIDDDAPSKMADYLKSRDITCLVIIPSVRDGGGPDRMVKVTEHWIAAAEKAGVSRGILVSWAGCDLKEYSPVLGVFKDLERMFLGTKHLEHKVVARAGFYLQNLFLYAPQIINNGYLPLPIPASAKFAPLDIAVLGKTVAHLAVCPDTISKFDNQLITLTGPEPTVSGPDLAKVLGDIRGKPVEFKQVSPGEAENIICACPNVKINKNEVKALLECYTLIGNSSLDFTTNDVQRVLGDEMATKTVLDMKQVFHREWDTMMHLVRQSAFPVSS